MSEFDFAFDAASAEKGDQFSTRIDTTGKYIGTIKTAHRIVAGSGTSGIALTLEAPEGGADVSLYCTKEDGTHTFGYNQVQAIMGVLGLKTGLRGTQGTARQYDRDSGQWEDAPAIVYPDLCGKPLGFVLQKRLYTSNSGKDSFSFDLKAVFDAATGQTWTERKTAAPAAKIEKLLAGLKDKDERKDKPAAASMDAGVADNVSF